MTLIVFLSCILLCTIVFCGEPPVNSETAVFEKDGTKTGVELKSGGTWTSVSSFIDEEAVKNGFAEVRTDDGSVARLFPDHRFVWVVIIKPECHVTDNNKSRLPEYKRGESERNPAKWRNKAVQFTGTVIQLQTNPNGTKNIVYDMNPETAEKWEDAGVVKNYPKEYPMPTVGSSCKMQVQYQKWDKHLMNCGTEYLVPIFIIIHLINATPFLPICTVF
jgi:hypothetical protein